MKWLIAIALLALTPYAALADAAAKPVCSTALNSALPAAWSDWATPETVPAAATPATQPEILLGRAYNAPLKATASVSYAVQPRKITDGTFGGLFMLTVEKAGIYTIGLDQAGWIDVVRDGKVIKSSGHGHGPDCSTVRKMVDFKLDPGHYTVQISNAPKDTAVIAAVAK
ncbi:MULTISPECIES: homogentisate 1,2-dioxygenase [Asticcacaulis]|uniref:homogentisate 1,2-dioxygenase n=1 Tax=Asticcacaulis TaxID=76890 RepID=UPI001AEA6697|nr:MULTISPECIES: homogentisate 1,2-dioxygenase [Asticcacaulis]MBP2160770.1 hypothetical protein [Asticcacaulis solisilvae]MDR6801815.1 hypothetical protein [Asticcacaulis sp. BE141]